MNIHKFKYCIWQIHNGNMNALEPIYTEYYEKLVLSAKRILRNRSAAEDAASEAILKFIEYAKEYARPKIENHGAYMYAIVRNAAIDIYNSNKSFCLEEDPETATTDDYGTDEDDVDRLCLEQALDSLDDTEFEIATRFYFYDYKIKDIAADLGMPEGTVKWKISEIKKHLKEFFEKD